MSEKDRDLRAEYQREELGEGMRGEFFARYSRKMSTLPPIEYNIDFNEDHIVESFRRYKQQRPTRFWFMPLKVLCFVGLAALLGLCLYSRLWVPALAFGAFLMLLAIGPKLDDWLIRRRFRRSPFYGLEVSVCLSERGFASADAKSKVELAWSAFSGVRRFDDGFLAFSGTGLFYWWPDRALKTGTVAEVAELLQRHTSDFNNEAEMLGSDESTSRFSWWAAGIGAASSTGSAYMVAGLFSPLIQHHFNARLSANQNLYVVMTQSPAFGLFMLLIAALGFALGGYVAASLAPSNGRVHATAAAFLIVVVGAVAYLGVFPSPYPAWVDVAGFLLAFPCMLLGARYSEKHRLASSRK